MRSNLRRLAVVIGILWLLSGCASSRAEDPVAALPWPEDGLYGMALDGYLTYFVDEQQDVQFHFIQLSRRRAASLRLEAVAIATHSGRLLETRGCSLLPGSTTSVYRLFTLSCQLQPLTPGSYRLQTLHLRLTDGTVHALPAGEMVVEVLPGTYRRDIFVSRWHLHRESSDEYRALLINEGSARWVLDGFRAAVPLPRAGRVAAVQTGSDYRGDPADFSPGEIPLEPGSSAVLRVTFERNDATMLALRPAVVIRDLDGGDAQLLTLQTTFYTPAFSPRDILAFTRNPRHLRTLSEAIRQPVIPDTGY